MFTEICNKFFYFVFPTSLLLSKKWELEASPTTPGCFPLLCSLFLKLVTKGWFFSVWRLLGKFLGEGNGTPLQHSCLENPMNGGACLAAVHGVGRVRHDRATSLSLFTFMHWRRQWQPTPVFLPAESQGWGSLVGCCLWGCTESDATEVT